jgi:hypothetical protein
MFNEDFTEQNKKSKVAKLLLYVTVILFVFVILFFLHYFDSVPKPSDERKIKNH